MEFGLRLLEDNFTRQLQLTGVVDSRGNHAKVLAILAGIRGTPNGMVESIECVKPQLELHGLKHGELPKERKVKVLVRFGAQCIPPSIPERVLSRRNKGSRIDPF